MRRKQDPQGSAELTTCLHHRPSAPPARACSGFRASLGAAPGGGQAAPTACSRSGVPLRLVAAAKTNSQGACSNTAPTRACSGFRFLPLVAPLQSSSRASCRCAPPLAPARASLRCAVEVLTIECALVISIFQILRHFRGAPRAILVFGGNYPLFDFGICFTGRPLCRFSRAAGEGAWLLIDLVVLRLSIHADTWLMLVVFDSAAGNSVLVAAAFVL